jgi:hypothetical protein
LPGGTITFTPVNTKSNPATGTIDENGNYSVTVAAGEATITVDNRALKNPGAASGPIGVAGGPSTAPGGKIPKGIPVAPPMEKMKELAKDRPESVDAGPKVTGKYVAIPEKYHSTATSGLKLTVTGGSQNYDVQLTK